MYIQLRVEKMQKLFSRPYKTPKAKGGVYYYLVHTMFVHRLVASYAEPESYYKDFI